jgi:hypothetical protein
MGWPLSQDYNEAVQSPARNVSDPDLRRGEAVVNALGLPAPCSGNFADVVLLGNDLLKFVETVQVARRCRRIIWFNFAGTLAMAASPGARPRGSAGPPAPARPDYPGGSGVLRSCTFAESTRSAASWCPGLSVTAAVQCSTRCLNFLRPGFRVEWPGYAPSQLAGQVAWDRSTAGAWSHVGTVKKVFPPRAT